MVFFTLLTFNYTLNAKSLNIALFLPFNSSAYSKMAESIHSGINDSLNKLDLNFDYFKIPSVSNIMKNQSLKRKAWVKLKLLKAKLDEF